MNCGLYLLYITDGKPQEQPIPADIAPILSRLTYSFMDGIVFHAWKVPHIGIDELPPLPVKEEAEVLRSKTFRVSSLYVSFVQHSFDYSSTWIL